MRAVATPGDQNPAVGDCLFANLLTGFDLFIVFQFNFYIHYRCFKYESICRQMTQDKILVWEM